MSLFDSLGLSSEILTAVNDLGFQTPTEVQQKSIPILLSKASDFVALAQTGTGKTAAFGFPLIQKINPKSKQTQSLILAPTRELCLQITNELSQYSKYYPSINITAVYGGANINEQARALRKGSQIIVATPGRMQDMIRRGYADISSIEFCILDEADEMLNMGFYEDIVNILSHTPPSKKTWLFSATMPKEVATIAKKFMTKPIEITVGVKNESTNTVRHEYYIINGRDKYLALKRLADSNPDIFSVVFCRTKRDTQNVAEKLIEDGYNAAALHGDLSQNQRDLVMKSFRSNQIQMLVATDVAARGIDVSNITHVINYQLPDDIETYTHRSGRTGRAGKSGVSMILVTKSEIRKIRQIEKIINKIFELKKLPSGIEICEIQLYHLANKIKNTSIDKEIENHLSIIEDVLGEETKQNLIKKVFSVEFNRFFSYYENAKDLNVLDNSSPNRDKFSKGEARFFINLGGKDGFDWRTLKDMLKDTINKGDVVSKVDVKEGFSFFNVDASLESVVFSKFKTFKLRGRNIRVEKTKKNFASKSRNRNNFSERVRPRRRRI
ncbi:ATP-dependent RNA helicase deaD-like protein [Elysia marginata]|uniref:RNA helicase n=1 Tax=Elysia marginata TaxID=1093978 RepID=A0AAV4FVY7_9GAST|nr:ATP-dependent RNA helicase deaD-like protein [Elysia marginata]